MTLLLVLLGTKSLSRTEITAKDVIALRTGMWSYSIAKVCYFEKPVQDEAYAGRHTNHQNNGSNNIQIYLYKSNSIP